MEHLESSERRFTKKLCEIMIPCMIEVFWEIWLEAQKKAKEERKPQNAPLVFQLLLQEIKTWNSAISLKHSDSIKKADPLFPKFLAAIFICHVKVLMNGVRLDKKPKKLALKLPPHDRFVQECYVECASDIYYHPKVIIDPSISEQERKKDLTERFSCKINTVIENLIPWDCIIGDLTHESADFDEEEVLEEPEEEVPDMPEEEDCPVTPLEGGPEHSATEPIAQSPNGSETYAVTPSLTPPTVKKVGPEGESLFDDAPAQ
jgi:Family of unknown function (DUF5764)